MKQKHLKELERLYADLPSDRNRKKFDMLFGNDLSKISHTERKHAIELCKMTIETRGKVLAKDLGI